MLLLAALLTSNPFYIVLKAVRLSEFYARSYQEHTVFYVKKFFCRKILYSTDAIMSRTLKDIAWRVVATFKCLLIVPKIWIQNLEKDPVKNNFINLPPPKPPHSKPPPPTTPHPSPPPLSLPRTPPPPPFLDPKIWLFLLWHKRYCFHLFIAYDKLPFLFLIGVCNNQLVGGISGQESWRFFSV